MKYHNEHKLPKKSLWQIELAEAITDPLVLLQALELDENLFGDAIAASRDFPLMVPRQFLNRIEKGNPLDPLLLQILPLKEEALIAEGFSRDPLKEKLMNPLPGLLQKYQGRVLLTLTSKCAVNCRFCFRKHFPYEDNNPGLLGLEKTLEYIAADPSIDEVILSGGDPLTCPDKLLQKFSDKLHAIPHIKRLRLHTRIPIVLPSRIDEGFLSWIRSLKMQVILVTHCNHPNELNDEIQKIMSTLKNAGLTLLNQSVLLKNINDSVDTLVALSEKLFSLGILPYYLHALDKVQGVQHFDLPKERLVALHQEMTYRLSGYLVPKLVFEEAGARAKTPLTLDAS